MFMSRTINLQIARPPREVYKFLLEPRNYPKWAATLDGLFEHVEGRDWRAETPFGYVVISFAEANELGVLDHTVSREGEEPSIRHMRVFANGDGAELTYTMFKREASSEEQFLSEVEWTTTELEVLKTYLELRA